MLNTHIKLYFSHITYNNITGIMFQEVAPYLGDTSCMQLYVIMKHSFVLSNDSIYSILHRNNLNSLPPLLLNDCWEENINYTVHLVHDAHLLPLRYEHPYSAEALFLQMCQDYERALTLVKETRLWDENMLGQGMEYLVWVCPWSKPPSYGVPELSG